MSSINFKHTPYGRYMKKIHNSHLGESCFIIGNGPSLSAEDLTKLHENNIDSFAVNRIFKIFPQTPWRPTYYVNTDFVLIRDILDEVNKLPVKHKFIPLQDKFYHDSKVKGAHHFFRNDLRENDQDDGFSLDCTEQVNTRGTVTIDCMQLAWHMGYKHIYLLGVDHNFDKVITENGEVIIAYRLQKDKQLALNIGIQIRYNDYETINRSKPLLKPTNDETELFRYAKEVFNEHFDETRFVRLIGAFTNRLKDAQEEKEEIKQISIFDDFDELEKDQKIKSIINKINKDVGKDALKKGIK